MKAKYLVEVKYKKVDSLLNFNFHTVLFADLKQAREYHKDCFKTQDYVLRARLYSVKLMKEKEIKNENT